MLENCYKFLGKKYEPVLRFLIHTIAITGWINFDARKLLQIFGQKYEPVLRSLIHTIAITGWINFDARKVTKFMANIRFF